MTTSYSETFQRIQELGMTAEVYIRALGRQMQRHHEFQASLGTEEDLAQKTKQPKQRGEM